MAGSPVKLGIIVAALVIGIVTLATAFESGSSMGLPEIPGIDLPSTVLPSSPAAGTETTKTQKPTEAGVLTGVYNGTDQPGEAGIVANKLARSGCCSVAEAWNTVDPQPKTIIYYAKPSDESAAQSLADRYFSGAPIQPKPEEPPLKIKDTEGHIMEPSKQTRLIVFIGDDYLSNKPA